MASIEVLWFSFLFTCSSTMFFARRVVKADKAGVMKGEVRVLSFFLSTFSLITLVLVNLLNILDQD